jgi:hypothetical protein
VLATERLTARLELTDVNCVNLVVYDGDDVMGPLELDGGYVEDGAEGMHMMLAYVAGVRRDLAKITKLALV